MTPDQFADLREDYLAYANSFADDSGRLAPMKQLKLDHSLRVAGEAATVAAELGWDDAEVRTAEAAGLLHDIGRYEQYRQYKTFVDRESCDHAECGRQVLCRTEILRALPEDTRAALKAAVRYHNRHRLPEDIPAEHLPLLQLVRDADKIDIYRVFLKTLEDEDAEARMDVFFRLDPDGPPSESILRAAIAGGAARYEDMRSQTDFLLVVLMYVFDINYRPSLEMIRRRGLLERIGHYLPDEPHTRTAAAAIRTYVDRRCAEAG